MTNPAVVILTDPARCQLAEADTLVQALLQLQQLNEAGVPASQAFCDDPAAAMEFIHAYTKAYPALQLQSSDLPPPQDLYGMVADGRLSPLQPAGAELAPKLEPGGQLYPLYVLSLGAPEALMQALQHNSLAKSSIRVLEIEPVEDARAEPVSVAEAVAATSLGRSSWLDESSTGPGQDDAHATGTGPLAESPVELSSVEVDLDRIQIDNGNDEQVPGQPAPVVGAAATGPDTGPLSVASEPAAPASSIDSPDPATQLPAPAAPPSEPASDAALAAPTDLPGTSITRSEVPIVAVEPPPDDGADAADEPARDDMEPSKPPDGEPDEQGPATGSDGQACRAPDESAPDVDNAAPAGPGAPEGDDADALAGHGCSFAVSGEDVVYQPTTSFSANQDLAYALPTDEACELGFFAPFLDSSEGAEVVDLEAMYQDLAKPAAKSGAGHEGLDCILMRPPNSARGDSNDPADAYSNWERSGAHGDGEPDQDEAPSQLTTVHDTDV